MNFSLKKTNIVFKNKTVLYFLFALAIINLLYYYSINNLVTIFLFLLLGVISSCFTKNMSLILLVPLIVTNVLFLSLQYYKRFREGFVEGTTGNDGEEGTGDDKGNVDDDNGDSEPEDDTVDPSMSNIAGFRNKRSTKSGMSNLSKLGLQNLNPSDLKDLDGRQQGLLTAIDKISPLLEKAGNMMDKLEQWKLKM